MGLEGTMTDAMSSVIISNAIVPRFRAGDFRRVAAGVDAVIDALTVDRRTGTDARRSASTSSRTSSTTCCRSWSPGPVHLSWFDDVRAMRAVRPGVG